MSSLHGERTPSESIDSIKSTHSQGKPTATTSSEISKSPPKSSSSDDQSHPLPSFRYYKDEEEVVFIPPPPPPPPPTPKLQTSLPLKDSLTNLLPSTSPDYKLSKPSESNPIDAPISKAEEDESYSEGSPPSICGSVSRSYDSNASGSQTHTKESSSPIKEAFLTKFAKFAPASTSSGSTISGAKSINSSQNELRSNPHESSPSTSSWLHSVKGRIARRVEEKYSEYKNEREKRLNTSLRESANSASLDLSLDDSSCTSTTKDACHDEEPSAFLSHSYSDQRINNSFSSLPYDLKTSHSNNFKPLEDFASEKELATSLPNHLDGNREDDVDGKTPVPSENHFSPQGRRRFTFAFLDKSSRVSSPISEEKSARSSATEKTPEKATASSNSPTPTRSSLRSRMMGFMGRSSQQTNVATPSTLTPSRENPFSGTLDLSEDFVEEALEADEKLVFDPIQDESEEGMMVDSSFVDEKDAANETDSPEEPLDLSPLFFYIALIPIAIILFLQLLPMPRWLIGFITGVLVAVPVTAMVAWHLYLKDNFGPATQFIENVRKKIPRRPAIIIQEELERKYTWMNIWPAKNGPYDPLTYDVRRTMSVRVMIHGPWIELKFPKRNFPLRKMHDDVEPENVEFHGFKEIINLTNCSLELVPENLPSKRVWSKKYPIKITTNVRKAVNIDEEEADKVVPAVTEINVDPAASQKDSGPTSSQASTPTTEKIITSDAFAHKVSDNKSDNGDDHINVSEVMHDAIGDEDSQDEEFEILPDSCRTFYLFARTSREKEEWFNYFMTGAKFMQDWNQQTAPRSKLNDPEHETCKVREQRFRMFMENYYQAKTAKAAEKIHEETRNDEVKKQVAKEQVAFLNIFGARLWHDLHNSKTFIDLLRDKLTRKLLKVKIAQYFEEVSVTTLDLGTKLPQILSASLPWQDENGLWANFDIVYTGVSQATVETQGIRLPAKDEPDREAQELISRLAATIDSDEEDSAEEDDDIPDSTEFLAGGPEDKTVHGSGFRARMLEGILKSEFVAKVAENEWVKKNITSRNITLQLQLHLVKGTLTVNMPPAPSDRIWYGFRNPPQMEIALRPCFGGRGLGKYENTFSSVMRLLEKRLKQEFMKVLVFPNMDDEVLPFLEHIPYVLKDGPT